MCYWVFVCNVLFSDLYALHTALYDYSYNAIYIYILLYAMFHSVMCTMFYTMIDFWSLRCSVWWSILCSIRLSIFLVYTIFCWVFYIMFFAIIYAMLYAIYEYRLYRQCYMGCLTTETAQINELHNFSKLSVCLQPRVLVVNEVIATSVQHFNIYLIPKETHILQYGRRHLTSAVDNRRVCRRHVILALCILLRK